MRKYKLLFRWLTLGLLGAAIYTEYTKDPDQRTGHGTVGGVVPYDFRTPTIRRFKSRLWNPQEERLFVPQAFGVGWTVNLYRAKQMWEQQQVSAADAEPGA